MFQGSIPQDMRNIVFDIIKDWEVSDVYVGCSGNFTVERIFAENGNFDIHGCDVTIYSCTIGAYLANQDFRLDINEHYLDDFGWLAPYIESPAGKVATIQLGVRLTEAIGSNGELKHNAYYDRMQPAYHRQWDAMYDKTMHKIESVPFSLSSFHVGDAIPWVKTLPSNIGIISYPPFFAGGYEVMFGKLDKLFDWDEPTYALFDPESSMMDDYLQSLMEKQHWVFGIPVILDEYKEYLRGVAHTTAHGVPIYVYANTSKRRIVQPRQTLIPSTLPRLGMSESVGSDIKLTRLDVKEFASLRSVYMNKSIKPSAPSAAFGILVDGKLVGAFAIGSPKSYSGANDVYMLSDFPVAPTKYRRLSKLVLYAALSKEARLLYEGILGRRIRQVHTTAFTDNQISMKYRGLFELVSRKESNGTSDKKYFINYAAKAG